MLLSAEYTFKNVNKTFSLKAQMSCNDSFNIIYAHICSGWLEEYIWETGVDKTRLRDMIRVYRQHIKQTEYQELKVKQHLGICGRGSFKIFPFLQMRSNDTNLRRGYETEYKAKLNQLWQIKVMTQRFNVLLITFRNIPTRGHNFFVQFYIVTQSEYPCLTP